MFFLSYSLRITLIIMALIVLMVMPALAGAPPAPAAPAVPHVPVARAVPAKPVATMPASATTQALPVGAGVAPCPPCEFCGMYVPSPLGPRVASPQLQGAGSSASYTPAYIGGAHAANPSGVMPAGMQPSGAPMSASMGAPTGASMPQGHAVNTYVSNAPMPAGPNPSLGEVWMRHGGARLQYDALRGPIQMNTNGRPVKDPALVHLPALYPTYTKPKVKKTVKPTVTATPMVKPAAQPHVKPGANTTHKLVPKPAPAMQSSPKHKVQPGGQAGTTGSTVPQGATPSASPSVKPSGAQPPKTLTPQNNVTQNSPTQNPSIGGEGVSRPAAPITDSPYDGPARL